MESAFRLFAQVPAVVLGVIRTVLEFTAACDLRESEVPSPNVSRPHNPSGDFQ